MNWLLYNTQTKYRIMWLWSDFLKKLLLFFSTKKCWNCLLTKHGVACDKIVICGGRCCDVMAASHVCCRQCVCTSRSKCVCVCVSAGIWRVKAGWESREYAEGEGNNPSGKGSHMRAAQNIHHFTFSVNLWMWNCEIAERGREFNRHETEMGIVFIPVMWTF